MISVGPKRVFLWDLWKLKQHSNPTWITKLFPKKASMSGLICYVEKVKNPRAWRAHFPHSEENDFLPTASLSPDIWTPNPWCCSQYIKKGGGSCLSLLKVFIFPNLFSSLHPCPKFLSILPFQKLLPPTKAKNNGNAFQWSSLNSSSDAGCRQQGNPSWWVLLRSVFTDLGSPQDFQMRMSSEIFTLTWIPGSLP